MIWVVTVVCRYIVCAFIAGNIITKYLILYHYYNTYLKKWNRQYCGFSNNFPMGQSFMKSNELKYKNAGDNI